MKKLLLTLAVAAMGFVASAQISAGLNGTFAMGMGDMSTAGFKTGFGGGVNGRYWLNDNMAAGLNVGYYTWTHENVSDLKYSFLPIMGAFDYYFTDEGFKPFVGVELGLVMATIDLGPLGSTSESVFGFAPVVGAAYGVSDNLDVFANVKYSMVMNSANTNTFLPISLGVNMKFGN